MLKVRTKNECIRINKEYNKVQRVRCTCKKWNNICKKHSEIVTNEQNDLRKVITRIVEHAVANPLKETGMGDDICEVRTWIYSNAENMILINRCLRNKYYERVVDQEQRTKEWCTQCNKEVRIKKDIRSESMRRKGKEKR